MKMIRHKTIGICICNHANVLGKFFQKVLIVARADKQIFKAIGVVVDMIVNAWHQRDFVVGFHYGFGFQCYLLKVTKLSEDNIELNAPPPTSPLRKFWFQVKTRMKGLFRKNRGQFKDRLFKVEHGC